MAEKNYNAKSFGQINKKELKPELNQLNAMIFPSNNALEFTTEIEKQHMAFPMNYISYIDLDKRNEPKLASLDICDRHGRTIFSYHQVYDASLVPTVDVENVTYLFDNIPTNLYKLNKFITSMNDLTDIHIKEISSKISDIDLDIQTLMRKNVSSVKTDTTLEEKLHNLIDEKPKLQDEQIKLNIQYDLSNSLSKDMNYALKLKNEADKLYVRKAERKIAAVKAREDRKFEDRIRVLAGSEDINEFLSKIGETIGSERYTKIIAIFKDETERLEKQEQFKKQKEERKKRLQKLKELEEAQKLKNK